MRTRLIAIVCLVNVLLLLAPAQSKTAKTQRPRVIAFIGDSATSPLYSPPGFPALVGQTLGLTIHNLATLSETRNMASYNVKEALTEELPRVPPDTTDAVIFLGSDDLNFIVVGKETLGGVEAAYRQLIDALVARNIRLYLVTPRNYSLDPRYHYENIALPPTISTAQAQASMQRVSDSLDDWIVRQGFPALDMRYHPDLVESSIYLDGVHFNPVGLRLFASYIVKWFQRCNGNKCVTLNAHGAHHRLIAFIGDSITTPYYSPPGYPSLVKQELRIPVHIVGDFTPPGLGYIWQGLEVQVPQVTPVTTDAVVFLGTDDIMNVAKAELSLQGTGPRPETLDSIKHDVAAIVAQLQARGIAVYLVTTRNYTKDPAWVSTKPAPGPELLSKMQAVTDALDDFELNLGVPVFDIREYPDLMASSAYRDGIHFTPSGMKLFAHELSRFLRDNGVKQ